MPITPLTPIKQRNKFISLASVALLALVALPLWAQFDFQVGAQPGGYGYVNESTAPVRPSIDPFAQVLTDTMLATKPTTYWETIDISTSDATRDFTSLLRRGFGRLELTTLLLMAEEAKVKLSDLVKKRVGGAKLKELASELKVAYAQIRAQSHQLKNKLLDEMQKKLENLKNGRSVESSTTTAKPAP